MSCFTLPTWLIDHQLITERGRAFLVWRHCMFILVDREQESRCYGIQKNLWPGRPCVQLSWWDVGRRERRQEASSLAKWRTGDVHDDFLRRPQQPWDQKRRENQPWNVAVHDGLVSSGKVSKSLSSWQSWWLTVLHLTFPTRFGLIPGLPSRDCYFTGSRKTRQCRATR